MLHVELHQMVSAIKNCWEEIDDASHSGAPTLVTDERHMERVKSDLDCTSSISCMAIVREVGISPASVYCILTNCLGNKNFVQSGFHMRSAMTEELCVFLPLPVCSIGKMKAVC